MIAQGLRVPKLCPALLPFIFFAPDVIHYEGTKGFCFFDGEVASFLVQDGVSCPCPSSNKASAEMLTSQEIMTGGLSQEFASNNWACKSVSYPLPKAGFGCLGLEGD